ncbi:MAG: LPXTG-motif cell wall anchor domain protein, partial [Thermomicrobiales bacterium]|nr:LPXTG-motif cell wall anchor domain protein [Thermomicrobiales bacterium]
MQPLSRGTARTVALIVAALALVAALLPLPASPVMAQDDDAEADATLRVIHASPGAPQVDVLLDGQTLLQGLTYGAASSYATITPEEHRLQVVPTGQTADAAVVDETIDAAPGQAYLLAVFGLLNDIGGDIYDVDLSEIEPGNARVRLINFSPDAGDIDLLETGGDEWFGNVALGDASEYR